MTGDVLYQDLIGKSVEHVTDAAGQWAEPLLVPRTALEDGLLRVLRRMEWQRAQGHLLAILETYWGSAEGEYERVDYRVQEFIEWMEDEL